MKEWFCKHKKLIITIIVLIVVIAIVLIVRSVKSSSNNNFVSIQTDTVEKRDISEYISASGTLISNDSVTVSSSASGIEILSINVKAGDFVNEGDIIATLDTSDYEEQLADAKKVAEANQANSDLTYANSIMTYQQQDHTNKETLHKNDTSLQSSAESYESAYDKYNEASISLSIAKMSFDQVDSSWADSSDIDKKKAYQQALLNLQSAEHSFASAERALKKASGEYSYEESDKPLDDRDANITLQQNANTLFQAMNSHSVAGISDQQNIRTIEQKIENGTIKAPVSGYITSVNAQEGSTYSGNGLVVIEDISTLRVSADISEYDITSVEVGQSVIIKTNATGKTEMRGVVAEIAPRSTKAVTTSGSTTTATTNGSVSYNVKIDIIDPVEGLKLDMSAKIKIMTSESPSALSVSYDAIQEDEEGYFVEVIDNPEMFEETDSKRKKNDTLVPETHKVYVTKGTEGDVYIEISGDGIKEGVKVLVPQSDEMANDIYSMMGGF